MYIDLSLPELFTKGYLLVVFVGSTPAVTAVPVAVAVQYLENFPPGKKPVPLGAVSVFPAAL